MCIVCSYLLAPRTQTEPKANCCTFTTSNVQHIRRIKSKERNTSTLYLDPFITPLTTFCSNQKEWAAPRHSSKLNLINDCSVFGSKLYCFQDRVHSGQFWMETYLEPECVHNLGSPGEKWNLMLLLLLLFDTVAGHGQDGAHCNNERCERKLGFIFLQLLNNVFTQTATSGDLNFSLSAHCTWKATPEEMVWMSFFFFQSYNC